MKSTAFAVLVAGVALVACRDESRLSKQQQQYDVVQEGSAAGANTPLTTTVPPVTATGADTTTAFQLPGATANPTQPGTMAGTLATPNVGVGGTPAYTPGQPPSSGVTQRAASPGATATSQRPAARVEAPRPAPSLTGGFSRPPAPQPSEPPPPVVPEAPVEDEPQDEPADDENVEEPAQPPSDTAPPPPGAQEHDGSREG